MTNPLQTKEALLDQQRNTLAEHRPVAWKNSIAARKGKALTQNHKDTIAASHREIHAKKQPSRRVPLRLIAEDALLGLSTVASAKKHEALYGKLGGHQADVYKQRMAMGFPHGWPAVYRHGDALAWNHFGDFCSDFGHTKKEWAPLIHASYRGFANRVRKKGDRPFSSPKPKDETVPHPGRMLNTKWDELIEQLCYTQKKRWRVRDFLASELRDIPARHAALMTAFGILGRALQNETAGAVAQQRIARDVDSVSEWICWQSIYQPQLQIAVRFLVSFRDLIRENPQLLVAGSFRAETLANELLARDYRATPGRIEEAVAGKLQPLHQNSLRKLTPVVESAPAAGKKRRKPHEHSKGWQPKPVTFRGMVDAVHGRFKTILENFRTIKRRHDPGEWKKQLTLVRVGGELVSDAEYEAVLQSNKTALAAAIRWASAREKITYKTGKNRYSQAKSRKNKN